MCCIDDVVHSRLVMFQFMFAGEIITHQQFVGYAITLVAFASYNYFKMTQTNKQDDKPDEDDVERNVTKA